MRILTLALAFLLPAVAIAQPLDSVEALDVAPVVTDETTLFFTILAGIAVVTVTALNLADGATCSETAVNVVGASLICAGVVYCFSEGAAASTLRLASGAAYPTDALAAFAAGEDTAEHRRSLARAAREAGRDGIVLRRVVTPPGGVGTDAPPEARLDLAVLDAKTGAWRPLGTGSLSPATTVSVPVGGDLGAATAEALSRAGL